MSQPAAKVRQGSSLSMRSWRKSNAPVCQSGVGSAGGQQTDRHAAGVERSSEGRSPSQSPRAHQGAVVSTVSTADF